MYKYFEDCMIQYLQPALTMECTIYYSLDRTELRRQAFRYFKDIIRDVADLDFQYFQNSAMACTRRVH